MSDLLATLPDFPAHSFSHILPSLDKACITVTDLLTLSPLDVAKRATVPTAEVKKLSEAILKALHLQLGLIHGNKQFSPNRLQGESAPEQPADHPQSLADLRKGVQPEGGTADDSLGSELDDSVKKFDLGGDRGYEPRWISSLDARLDRLLQGVSLNHNGDPAGGFPTGYVSEVTGESGTGKTTLLLTLLLSVQLPAPLGLNKSALYISTEAALSTERLSQILQQNHILKDLTPEGSVTLSRILSIQCPDLESQEHILRYQVPVAIERHEVGLLVIDSIAANFRAEFDSKSAVDRGRDRSAKTMADRRTKLVQLGQLLRDIARKSDVAVVVANQVADRFLGSGMYDSTNFESRQASQQRQCGTQQSLAKSQDACERPRPYLTEKPLTLDHQQRFFTGWGHIAPSHLRWRFTSTPVTNKILIDSNVPLLLQHQSNIEKDMKTPTLGLVWTNQLACRIALSKIPSYNLLQPPSQPELAKNEHKLDGSENAEKQRKRGTASHWTRYMRVVFAAWVGATEDNEGVGERFTIEQGGLSSRKYLYD